MPTQVPNVAKIRFLEANLFARKEILLKQKDQNEKFATEYAIEMLEAILDDYKRRAKNEPAP